MIKRAEEKISNTFCPKAEMQTNYSPETSGWFDAAAAAAEL